MGCNNFASKDHDDLLSDSLAGTHSELRPEFRGTDKDATEHLWREVWRHASAPSPSSGSNLSKPLVRQTHRIAAAIGYDPLETLLLPSIIPPATSTAAGTTLRHTLQALHDLDRVPHLARGSGVISAIIFEPKTSINARGYQEQSSFKPSTRELRIYWNGNHEFPSGEDLRGTLAHEIYHANAGLWNTLIDKYSDDWLSATAMGCPSKYARDLELAHEAGTIAPDTLQTETRAEWYRLYAIGRAPSAVALFFDDYRDEMGGLVAS